MNSELSKYTQKDWERDKTLNPQVGQLVEDSIVWDIMECCPSTYMSPDYAQPGEAECSRESDGEPLYMTFKAEKEAWRYIGLFPDMNYHEIKNMNR